ncbi:ATP synthase F1 subunit gamma [Candidatus Gottesmanbacteria bacterium RBG_16_52_11]|uniref:ATP synthase gamma chain n=1 Tax=Candidatus Gottesmanbacteria bacterium RBG_16_52_11 TaxID=1798374 RepID=A0A1F5YQM9_9BACT|nr:MAG: ATP synthase F1 subunit gamma [Candidatus Gottesmanbacteria bacterium RBG_16_52_11]
MANIRLIKGRIKTAKNIAQITKAMELVAASKMKKAQAEALAGRVYAGKIHEMVHSLAARTDSKHHPLLTPPRSDAGKLLVILVSTNKGLAGGLNTNLFRYLMKTETADAGHEYITLGKKGADFLVRIGREVVADFSDTTPWVSAVPPVIELATGKFLSGTCRRVDIVYSDFISALIQVPTRKTVLPLSLAKVESQAVRPADIEIEPSVEEVFSTLLPHYIENQLRDAVLEAEASEHSARMIAMRNATDNAVSLMQELTLVYNKARQEKITYEITDMITARLAVS